MFTHIDRLFFLQSNQFLGPRLEIGTHKMLCPQATLGKLN